MMACFVKSAKIGSFQLRNSYSSHRWIIVFVSQVLLSVLPPQNYTAVSVDFNPQLRITTDMKLMALWTAEENALVLVIFLQQECVTQFMPRVSVLMLIVEKSVRVASDRMDLLAQRFLMI